MNKWNYLTEQLFFIVNYDTIKFISIKYCKKNKEKINKKTSSCIFV